MTAQPPGSDSQQPADKYPHGSTGGIGNPEQQGGWQQSAYPQGGANDGAPQFQGQHYQSYEGQPYPQQPPYGSHGSGYPYVPKKRRPGVWVAIGVVALLALGGLTWGGIVLFGGAVYALDSDKKVESVAVSYEGDWRRSDLDGYERQDGYCRYNPQFMGDFPNMYRAVDFDPNDVDGSADDVLSYIRRGNSGTASRGEDFSLKFDGVGSIEFLAFDYSHRSSIGGFVYYTIVGVHYFGESDQPVVFELTCENIRPTVDELVELMEDTKMTLIPLSR